MIEPWTQGYEFIPQNPPTPQLVAFCLRSIHHPRSRRRWWVSSQIQQAFTYALAEPLPRDLEHQPVCLLPPLLLVSHHIDNLSTKLVLSVSKSRLVNHDISATFNPYL